jgi:general secretion pathway protein K
MKSFKTQGVALITVMLILTLIVIISTSMINRQAIDIRRSANILNTDQALMFSWGIEDWARHLLITDGKKSQMDHLDENWAQVLPPISVDGGQIGGRLEDLQSRYNLNNLWLIKQRSKKKSDWQYEEDVCRRLLLEAKVEDVLVEALIDWMDKDDDTTGLNGAEDGEYLNQDIPYRSANGLLSSLSEVALIQGFTHKSLEKLQPLFTTLPIYTPINVNTADAQVLSALSPNISDDVVTLVIKHREENPFKSSADFFTLLKKEATKDIEKQIPEHLVRVQSHFFLLQSNTWFGEGQIQQYSVLFRQPGKAKNLRVFAIGRSYGGIW